MLSSILALVVTALLKFYHPTARTAPDYLPVRPTHSPVQPDRMEDGDSYDNALAETIIGLYKTEVINHEGPWNEASDVEVATLEWVHWFNHHRLLEPIGGLPPAEFEQAYYQHSQAIA